MEPDAANEDCLPLLQTRPPQARQRVERSIADRRGLSRLLNSVTAGPGGLDLPEFVAVQVVAWDS